MLLNLLEMLVFKATSFNIETLLKCFIYFEAINFTQLNKHLQAMIELSRGEICVAK